MNIKSSKTAKTVVWGCLCTMIAVESLHMINCDGTGKKVNISESPAIHEPMRSFMQYPHTPNETHPENLRAYMSIVALVTNSPVAPDFIYKIINIPE